MLLWIMNYLFVMTIVGIELSLLELFVTQVVLLIVLYCILISYRSAFGYSAPWRVLGWN